MRKAIRKVAALAALLALLLSCVSVLAETISARDLACCNTVFCPMHHHQTQNVRKDKSDCGAMSVPGQNGYSVRACDTAPNPAVGTAVFVLTAPVALCGPALAENARPLVNHHFLSAATAPLIPPPRTLPS